MPRRRFVTGANELQAWEDELFGPGEDDFDDIEGLGDIPSPEIEDDFDPDEIL